MGVSGSGKTTVAKELAARLGWAFEEGDSLHPALNIAKMHAGIPLTDEDRLPWLERVAAWIDAQRAKKQPGIITCSALKRSYRRIIIGDRPEVRLVYLRGGKDLIAEHLAGRHGHFMPSSLLQSQIDTLEEPDPSEDPLIVDEGAPPGRTPGKSPRRSSICSALPQQSRSTRHLGESGIITVPIGATRSADSRVNPLAHGHARARGGQACRQGQPHRLRQRRATGSSRLGGAAACGGPRLFHFSGIVVRRFWFGATMELRRSMMMMCRRARSEVRVIDNRWKICNTQRRRAEESAQRNLLDLLGRRLGRAAALAARW